MTGMAQSSTLYYACLPDKPAYLQPAQASRSFIGESKDGAGETTSNPVSTLAPYSTLFMFHIPQTTQSGGVNNLDSQSYVQSCLSCYPIYRQLCEIPELSNRVDFVLGAKISDSSLTRQLFAFVADDTNDDAVARSAFDCLELHLKRNTENVAMWMYRNDKKVSNGTVQWKLQTAFQEHSAVEVAPEVLEEMVNNVPLQSPIFREERYSPVFHDQHRVMEVLDMYSECDEVSRLKEIAREQLTGQNNLEELSAGMKHPLVVVEGIDGTGKTVLTQILEEKLQAARYSTPPPCLMELRQFFDRLPEIVRRAYYSLGNYIVAQQIARECQNRAVVMDRHWHSTAAYGIATETSLGDLPSPGHPCYIWPSDLLRPTAVVFLTVSEDVRRQRLDHRQDNEVTFEERRLNKDRIFRQRLCEAYLRMRDPACIQVDASGTEDEVVSLFLRQLQQQGIHLA